LRRLTKLASKRNLTFRMQITLSSHGVNTRVSRKIYRIIMCSTLQQSRAVCALTAEARLQKTSRRVTFDLVPLLRGDEKKGLRGIYIYIYIRTLYYNIRQWIFCIGIILLRTKGVWRFRVPLRTTTVGP